MSSSYEPLSIIAHQTWGAHQNALLFINILKKFKFITAVTVCKVNIRHCAILCADRSNHCRDVAVFRFFKMAP